MLEAARASHEELERIERLIVKELQSEPSTARDRLYQSHRVRYMIDQITDTTNKLTDIYQHMNDDQLNGTKDEQILAQLEEQIRDYQKTHPVAMAVDVNEELEQMILKEEPRIEFSGEEGMGRYLDLHELYNDYINSKFGEPLEYSAYLDVFTKPHTIIRRFKFMRQYREYLQKQLEYLVYFIERTEPLRDIGRMFSKITAEFEEEWANGRVPADQDNTVMDLDAYSNVEELMEGGPEKLKKALGALGLKTGGTVLQRAERLFLTKYTLLEDMDSKHFAKGHPRSGGQDHGSVPPPQLDEEDAKEIALMEAKLQKLCELLEETISRTKENVERKQALTYREMKAEREAEEETQAEAGSDDEEEEELEQRYNPLKLPMGWDGENIPYWLYKLHGLNQEFSCEICGNHRYRGRRAFEQHFRQSRHQHGMRCLGIPNTKNFNEITSIVEARQLWQELQQRERLNEWHPDLQEEYEDQEGNIYNKRTYTDLQRQGLL